MAFVAKLNDAVCIKLPFPFSSIFDHIGWSCILQVASSAAGKWFKLDGSGAKRERKGSRFTVRFWDELPYVDMLNFKPF